jgi:hypothetical protein
MLFEAHSATENVLAEYPDEVPEDFFSVPLKTTFGGGAFTWVFQEKAKGARVNYALGTTHVGSYYMGWGFNLKDPISANDPYYWKWTFEDPDHPENGQRGVKSPAEIGPVPDTVLQRNPVFDPGWGQIVNQAFRENPVSDTSPVGSAPDWIFNLYLSSGGSYVDETSHHDNRAWLMAEGIPALTWAVGSHRVDRFEEQNFDMPTLFADNTHWPRGNREGTNLPDWRHNDLRVVAYLYQFSLFDKLVTISNQ